MYVLRALRLRKPAADTFRMRVGWIKQALIAGVVAGVVVACAEPAAEIVGDMMNAAGRTGMQVLNDAGIAMPDASPEKRTIGSDAKAQEPAGDGLPRAHWVLRDADGEAVQADVYPGYEIYAVRFSESMLPCVTVSYKDKRSIGLSYRLLTGKLDGCETYPPTATWRASPYVRFADSGCQGTPYLYFNAAIVLKIGSTYYYTEGQASTHAATYYQWDAETSTCTASSPVAGIDLWAFKPVPNEIVNLLPDAPYTMAIVY
jgi:hypothetical protein